MTDRQTEISVCRTHQAVRQFGIEVVAPCDTEPSEPIQTVRLVRFVGASVLSCLLAGMPATAVASPVLVQSASADGKSPITAVFGSTPTQNNLLVAVYLGRLTGTLTRPPDWATAVDGGYITPAAAIYYKVAGASESTSVTVNSTAAGPAHGLMIYEFSGTATTPPVYDGAANNAAGTSATVASGIASNNGVSSTSTQPGGYQGVAAVFKSISPTTGRSLPGDASGDPARVPIGQ